MGEKDEVEITADTIIDWARDQIKQKKMPSREMWLDMAFRLNLLKIEEAYKLNKARQDLAKQKFSIYQGQQQKNVSAANLEIEALDEFVRMRNQQDKLEGIEEFVRIAKKNSESSY